MPGTRLFFGLCLIASLALLIAIPLTAREGADPPMSAEAAAGWHVWREIGCDGCHTVYGRGSVYAPDLTQIYQQRGEVYLREFLFDPRAFHADHARSMPNFGLTVAEIDSLLALLEAIGSSETASVFPPRMIRVSGGISAEVAAEVAVPDAGQSVPADPVARGRYWFSRPPAACATCHSLEPDVVIVGPSLAGVATRAGERVPDMSAEAYIRQSMLDPGAFVVPGFENVMAQNLAEVLNSDQINDLIAFLLTLE